ncbi:MAG: hypothetical protein Q9182_000452 [Xanthomendoza sp. 2 TL-2023]
MGVTNLRDKIYKGAKEYHAKAPGLSKIPFPAIAIILAVSLVNALVWVAVGIVLVRSFQLRDDDATTLLKVLISDLAPTAIISYTLGLRHAIDADHIVIIDLVTRPATAAAISSKFGTFSRVGGIIGTSVSAGVLILLGVANVYILWKLVKQLRRYLSQPVEEQSSVIQGYGSWKMYPLGVLFGAGFDTSSEIALLGIASIQGAKGTSIWLILIFPVLFTAGMCLLDTIDGALMMSLYTSTSLANDRIAILYYSIVLTLVTVVVAMVIGFIQLLSLIANVSEPSGKFWDGVAVAGDHYDVIGMTPSVSSSGE